MGMKLHRSRPSMFRRKHPWLRALAWTVACVAVVALGFFGAQQMDKVVTPPATSEPTASTDDTSTPPGSDTLPSQPAEPTVTLPQENDTLRGFYLPHSALRDSTTLPSTLEQAAKAGFTAVVFDLKDRAGQLYYHFACQPAQQVGSYTADAFTAEELPQLFATIRGAGLQPIPRLYAFEDNLGAKALAAARISPTGNPGWTWYDGDPNGGGKAWLNPYADEAHSYLIQLAQELRQAGAAAILLDGVQFPAHTLSASFGTSSNTNLSHSQVLTLFVDKMKTALEDCPLILSCTAEGALGNNTQVYGGNPLTFAPTMAAPTLSLAALPERIVIGETVISNTPDTIEQTVQALVSQMVLRTKVMAEDSRPHILPWLSIDGYTGEQIHQKLAGCVAGGCEGFILYREDGHYDFATLQLP